MSQKEIKILQAQIEKLEVKDFDLDAWKKYTIIILARIFGDTSQKVKQIESIEYDYSSWSLRDTSGSSSYLETCKKLGREILEASIEELKIFGLPEQEKGSDALFEAIDTALDDELKGSQYKEIIGILSSIKKPEIKRTQVLEKLQSFSTDTPTDILAAILSSPAVINRYKE